jgi:DNA-binding transcriptional LysR family regulator
VPLLDRIGHRSKLTAAGEIAYRRAQRILAERDDLIAELGELRGLKRGTLRLGLLPVGSGTLFAPLFAIYRKRYPGIDIRLMECGSERLQEVLLSGEIELAASLLPASEGLEWKDVQREPLTVLLPAGHTLSRRRSVNLLALRELPFILFESRFALNRIILDACLPTRLRADCRRAQQPDRFHCRACRHRHGGRLSAADGRGAAQASFRRPRAARRSGHGLARRHDLAARRLSVACREGAA